MPTRPQPAPPPDLTAARTLAEVFAWRVAQTPHAEAYRDYDDAAGRWTGHSWGDVGAQVARFTTALAAQALPPGARIAVLLPNGLPAVCVDQAALALGCVPVPLHALDNPASIAYILADSDASLLVAATEAQWRAIAEVGVTLPLLRQVVVLGREPGGAPSAAAVPVATLDEWLSRAPPRDAERPLPPRPEDLATLVYTSGTTGKPKGVMLTHDNVVTNTKAVLHRVAPQPGDVFLSFLPLSHTFERTAGYYVPIAAGCCVAFARSTRQLPEDLKTVRPTILVSVPRIYERMFVALQARVAGSPLRSLLLAAAQAVGWRRFRRVQHLASYGALTRLMDALAWPLLERLVARPLRDQFGGRLRLAVSGGAALAPAVARCCLGLGVPIVQGYGMTETSPIVAANAPDDNDPATVGRPVPGVEVRIGENRELLVRGPNVMRGYWKRDEDTARAFVDGWLRTGDQAAIESGRIRILGRVKEIIVTSTGEKIAPTDLELAITADASFESAYAFGDNRPFIGCVVVLNRGYWDGLAARLGLDPRDPSSLAARPATAAVLQTVRDLTGSFPYYAQPRGVVLSAEPWTIENTLLTPTLKLKRNNLAAHFAAQIEQLYAR
jgi:long-chain acyl-CoA synthetase